MNYIKQLAGFFDRVVHDDNLNPTHISMYVALFQFWNACRFRNPISISRNELMKVSKISSKATYHKCMKELHNLGYLKYMPSYNPYKGSLVYLFNFETSAVQAPLPHHTKFDTGTELAQEPYINNTNSTNQTIENLGEQYKKNLNADESFSEAKEKSSAKKERLDFANPPLQSVVAYFASQSFPPDEAEKFFNYFESNGWLVGGKSAMKNWQAAANNWMLNAKKFAATTYALPSRSSSRNKPISKQLHASVSKNYSEPL